MTAAVAPYEATEHQPFVTSLQFHLFILMVGGTCQKDQTRDSVMSELSTVHIAGVDLVNVVCSGGGA